MPRRPVKPQDRQRVVRACDACKSSKKRCDGNKPCNGCKKKGNSDTCHYTPGRRHYPLPEDNSGASQMSPTRRSRLGSDSNATHVGMMSPTSLWEAQDTAFRSPSASRNNCVETPQHHDPDDQLEEDAQGSTSDTMGQPPVMLSSVSGEKVFVGNTASMSFLCFLQRTLKRYAGPSTFTDAQESQSLFEADTTDMGSNRFYNSLAAEDRVVLIKYFLDASSGLLDLYSWEEVAQMMDTHSLMSTCSDTSSINTLNSLEIASLYLMVAIGAQCCGSNKEEVSQAAELFSFARKMALEKMLENPSLEMVRAFLLMAFYMFGACRRNSAFMYLGVASKAADILGLHMTAHHTYLTPQARNARLRTAKSLRVFDVVCNSILGRPSSTPSIRTGRTSYVNDDINVSTESLYRALALGATYEVSAVLDTAVTKSSEGGLHTEAAENLVLSLQQRSRNFPSILRQPDADEAQPSRYVTIGNVHVSGSYYFSVILVTRMFLIQHVVPQLSEQARSSIGLESSPPSDSTRKAKVAQLANACIEAATFMAQMCHQVMKSGNLIGNMCIVKAWMFATGLVLGFSGLIEDGRNGSERRTAFLKSLHVLGELKRLSPQAEQYYNILSSFHLAIKAYRDVRLRQKQTSPANLVDRVFLPSIMSDFDDAEIINTQLPSPDLTAIDGTLADWQHDLPLGPINGMMPIDPALFGDNDIITRMLWESERHAIDFPNPGLVVPDMTLGAPMQDLGSVLP